MQIHRICAQVLNTDHYELGFRISLSHATTAERILLLELQFLSVMNSHKDER